MKNRKLTRKLVLNKMTVSSLDRLNLRSIRGGAPETFNDPCLSNYAFCTVDTRCIACNTDYPCMTVDIECI